MDSNPVGASELFLGFICNCLSYFITARITFNYMLIRFSYVHSTFIIIVTQCILK